MNVSQLKKLSYKELQYIAFDMDIKISQNKDELILNMMECFKKLEEYKKKIDKYEKIKQLGNKGKEGVTYLVRTKDNKEYAMKTFKKTKSSDKIRKEADLQATAALLGIAPKVIEIDTTSKRIIMEKMDTHLIDIMKKQNGDLLISQQKQLIRIFKDLDKAKVFHADSNILNYMFKNKKLFIIDFGMSSKIDTKLIKKLGTDTPNLHIMNLGFILKLKELSCPESSYKYLLNYISNTEKERFKL